MELQWPLILFTTLVSASAGLFAAQGVYVLVGKGVRAQRTSLYASAALLALGGISVFLHLQHWERVFNGFGHITSGITQELIAVVVMAAVMIAFFVVLRREGGVPKWCAIAAILASVALVVIAGLSYMMAARPAWNSLLQVSSLLGLAFAAGSGAFAFIDRKADEDAAFHGACTLTGSVVNVVGTVAFVLVMTSASGGFSDVGYYFDPNHPTAAMAAAATYSPFSGSVVAFTVLALVFALAAVACAFYGRKRRAWASAGLGVALFAVVGGILLRMVFFACGGSVFMFY